MTLLDSERIIKHYLQIPTFAIKSKNGKKSTKFVKKIIFVTKIPNTFDFLSQKPKKNRSYFSQTFHMESLIYESTGDSLKKLWSLRFF